MPKIIGVRFRTVGKVYYFAPNDIVFDVGDGVIVETARGVEYGDVVIANREVDESEIVGTLKPVVRKANEKDKEKHLKNEKRKAECMEKARQKIEERKLEMKLKDVEFTFDGGKIIFYFASETRVDFRELVKDLAALFHARIELRQIGIRDETKMLGGLGPCGRACCCNQFLKDFERVSIKMAKTQGLSLNPTKISGLCGRLMCCLKYENNHYAETAKLMPMVGSDVMTPDGRGRVESVNLIKKSVFVKITKGDAVEFKTFDVAEIKAQKTIAEDADETVLDEEIKSILD